MNRNEGNPAPKARGAPPPLPSDAPLLAPGDVASYLRLSRAAVARLLDGRADSSDGELGEVLRRFTIRLSPRRRYVLREPFMAWLQEKTQGTMPAGAEIQEK